MRSESCFSSLPESTAVPRSARCLATSAIRDRVSRAAVCVAFELPSFSILSKKVRRPHRSTVVGTLRAAALVVTRLQPHHFHL
ncbi:hypothetical protein M3J09_000713 [Ascochyta lentis]